MSGCTQKEIARKLGISQALVSQVLSGKKKGGTSLHRKILQVGRQLNYLPNHAAFSLKTGKRHTWGLILPSFTWLGDFNLQVVQGIWQIAFENQQSLSLTSLEGSSPGSQEYLRHVRQGRFDGIFLFYTGKEKKEDIPFEEIHRLGITTLVVNCPMFDRRTHYVCSDAASGVCQAVRHLAEVHGRRRIAFLNHDENSWQLEDRYQGYLRAHEELGLPVDPALTVEFRECGSYENNAQVGVEELLGRGVPFDAICSPMDYVAIPAMGVLQDRGIRVPEEVSVVGFDDFHLCAGVRPQLTTVRCDGAAMGRKAAEMMLEVCENKEDQSVRSFRLPVSLVVRQSCGCTAAGPEKKV